MVVIFSGACQQEYGRDSLSLPSTVPLWHFDTIVFFKMIGFASGRKLVSVGLKISVISLFAFNSTLSSARPGNESLISSLSALVPLCRVSGEFTWGYIS